MPNFAELLAKSCCGILKSTQPPYTPPAWSSFYTGVNPGKHGIYGFTFFNPVTKRRELSNSRVMGSKKIWQILNDHGISTGLINLPLTYPPEKVDGYMITGMMTPERSKNFTYPESLGGEIGSLETEYIVDVPLVPVNDSGNLHVLKPPRKSMEGRRAAYQHMLKHHPCDFVMIVFVTPDRLQHVYWKYLDEKCSLYDTRTGELFRKEILQLYGMLDGIIGDIIAGLGNETNVFIISDHGFTELRSEFIMNNWLKSEGFFNLTSAGKRMWMPGYKRLRSGRMVKFLSSGLGGRLRERGMNNLVDWGRSAAYSREQGLFINLVDRDEHGLIAQGAEYENTVREIADKLKRFINPHDGIELASSISFKDELYHGDYAWVAPDLVPVLDDYRCYVHDGILRKTLVEDRSEDPHGAHHAGGIFMAYGPNIGIGGVENARIIDVAPTILYSMGLPVPQHMDGKELAGIFRHDFVSKNPVSGVAEDTSTRSAADDDVYSQEEADAIEEQLRNGISELSG